MTGKYIQFYHCPELIFVRPYSGLDPAPLCNAVAQYDAYPSQL